jgi:hypothetical protein
MRLAPHTLRWGCALARRTDSRRSLRPSGAFHGGISPGRFRGVWLHRSPPRPCTHPLSEMRAGPRGPYDRDAPHANACARDPPDLDAGFPVTSRSLRPSLAAGLPLLGFPKIAPPSSHVEESGAQVRVSAGPSGIDGQSFPRSALVVSHHLGGFLLSDGAGLLRPAPDPGVRRVSSRRETGLLTARSCPSKLSLRRQRRPRLSPEPRARVRDRPSLDLSFTARLAPSPFAPVHREEGFPSHVRRAPPLSGPRRLPGVGASRPCSIVGSVALHALPRTKARCSLGLG